MKDTVYMELFFAPIDDEPCESLPNGTEKQTGWPYPSEMVRRDNYYNHIELDAR